MKARHVPGLAEMNGDEQPGDFEVVMDADGARGSFWFVCPGPCRRLSALSLIEGPEKRTWKWDGNVETPTLDPSINHVDCWHGWLRNGEFTPA